MWLRKLLSDLRVPANTIDIRADNLSAVKLLKKQRLIDVAYHFARKQVELKELPLLPLAHSTQCRRADQGGTAVKSAFCHAAVGVPCCRKIQEEMKHARYNPCALLGSVVQLVAPPGYGRAPLVRYLVPLPRTHWGLSCRVTGFRGWHPPAPTCVRYKEYQVPLKGCLRGANASHVKACESMLL